MSFKTTNNSMTFAPAHSLTPDTDPFNVCKSKIMFIMGQFVLIIEATIAVFVEFETPLGIRLTSNL